LGASFAPGAGIFVVILLVGACVDGRGPDCVVTSALFFFFCTGCGASTPAVFNELRVVLSLVVVARAAFPLLLSGFLATALVGFAVGTFDGPARGAVSFT
jgi:hypothetical protein